jgi:serine/threonine-protein kinase PpkA
MDETTQLSIQVPGYTIVKKLGSGAMAVVYLAIQDTLERQVALKIMASSLQADETFQKRFLKEGKIIAQLNHPNIVTIYDIGIVGSNNYMAMEYVDGGITLEAKIMPRQGMPPEQAIDVLEHVASALGYAHKRNFVHRDVKPANILFREDGMAVLSDFGIAKALGEGTAMTREGWAVGTPSYMSPEQALGKPIDRRCDIYCLGVVLFEMLTGERPYQANDSFAVALKHVNDPIPVLPGYLENFQPLIDQMMAKQPDERFDSAEQVIAAARAIQPLRAPTPLLNTATLPPTSATPPSPSPASNYPGRSLPGDESLSPSASASASPSLLKRPWLWAAMLATVLVFGGAWLGRSVWLPWLPIAQPSCTQQVALSAQQEQQIEGLWVAIGINLDPDIGRLVSPPISNAAYGLQEVLKLDPCNERASLEMAALPEKVLAQIQAHRASGETQEALVITNAGLAFFPENSELERIRQALQ